MPIGGGPGRCHRRRKTGLGLAGQISSGIMPGAGTAVVFPLWKGKSRNMLSLPAIVSESSEPRPLTEFGHNRNGWICPAAPELRNHIVLSACGGSVGSGNGPIVFPSTDPITGLFLSLLESVSPYSFVSDCQGEDRQAPGKTAGKNECARPRHQDSEWSAEAQITERFSAQKASGFRRSLPKGEWLYSLVSFAKPPVRGNRSFALADKEPHRSFHLDRKAKKFYIYYKSN
jgi:hypothetical protein